MAENPDSLGLAAQAISVDLLSCDSNGLPVDSLLNTTLTRFDNDNDPAFINYRSDLVRPLIFVDAPVNKSDFPGVRILIVSDGGSALMRRR